MIPGEHNDASSLNKKIRLLKVWIIIISPAHDEKDSIPDISESCCYTSWINPSDAQNYH